MQDILTKNTLISVCMITYKHDAYIRDAIEGVLMQKGDFELELIVADDCSPDRTAMILEELQKTHPRGHCIRYKRHEKNLGIIPNFIWTLEQAKGDFIALCEGDDYWTDPDKLQKQITFLNAHSEYNLCGHYVSKLKQASFQHPPEEILINNDFFYEDYIYKYPPVPMASIMYRNNLTLPQWMKDVYGGDRAILFLNAQKGTIRQMNFNGGVYRVHAGGIEQKYKKDKFSLPFRNILEEKVYYNVLEKKAHKLFKIKRILFNYSYVFIWSILKFKPTLIFISSLNLVKYLLLFLFVVFLYRKK
jgi:glycosyltransferase involved in cell wall biosynthesis